MGAFIECIEDGELIEKYNTICNKDCSGIKIIS